MIDAEQDSDPTFDQPSKTDEIRHVDFAARPLQNARRTSKIKSLGSGVSKLETKYAKPLRRYLQPNGLIPICAKCGKLRRHGSPVWDEVATELVTGLDNLTHGMCPDCQVELFPGLPSSSRKRAL